MKVKNSKNIFFIVTLFLINKIKAITIKEVCFNKIRQSTNKDKIDTLPKGMRDMIIRQKSHFENNNFIIENELSQAIGGNHIIEIYDSLNIENRKLLEVYTFKNPGLDNIQFIWKIIRLPNVTETTYFLLKETVILEMIHNTKFQVSKNNYEVSLKNYRDYLQTNNIKKAQQYSYVDDPTFERFLTSDYTKNDLLNAKHLYYDTAFMYEINEIYIGERSNDYKNNQESTLQSILNSDYFDIFAPAAIILFLYALLFR